LREAGITAIEGGIVGDDNAFDDESLGAGWSWDYLVYGYAAPVGPLQYNECLARIVVRPGIAPGAPGTVEAPEAGGFIAISRVLTGEPESRAQIDFRRLPGSSVLEVTGQVPAGGDPLSRTVSIDNPTLYFVRALREALVARGIGVSGEAVDIDDLVPARGFRLQPEDSRGFRLQAEEQEPRVLATWTSPPLSAIGTVLMKVSQNLYAETLLKTVGQAHGLGTTENGRVVVREVLESWGVTPDQYRQYDGSGLSRYNYVTAGGIVTILRHMALDERVRDPWMATLPVAGQDGTLGNRMRRAPLTGNVAAKTGTIANVRSLSGYVTTRDGERLAFSIIANHFLLPSATIDYASEIAVEYLANFTRR
jgi:D-alanyl-D-alanine carboxypeptidase/D-alanyl-D-alanine-endopeptidase (penicillin-binding protein 4)